jgi:hypothetical protein
MVPAAAATVWAVAADGARLHEWFALVQSSEASGSAERRSRRVPYAACSRRS